MRSCGKQLIEALAAGGEPAVLSQKARIAAKQTINKPESILSGALHAWHWKAPVKLPVLNTMVACRLLL